MLNRQHRWSAGRFSRCVFPIVAQLQQGSWPLRGAFSCTAKHLVRIWSLNIMSLVFGQFLIKNTVKSVDFLSKNFNFDQKWPFLITTIIVYNVFDQKWTKNEGHWGTKFSPNVLLNASAGDSLFPASTEPSARNSKMTEPDAGDYGDGFLEEAGGFNTVSN